MAAITTPHTYLTQLATARNAVDWATNAIKPFPADLVEQLRAANPTGVAKAEAQIAMITKALPYLTAIRDDLEDRACWRCHGTGEYGGPSGYTRRGRKYCFTCNGNGYSRPATPATPAPAPATPVAMTRDELATWLRHRGVDDGPYLDQLLTELHGKTEDQMDEIYSAMHCG